MAGVLAILTLLVLGGCFKYSFTGASEQVGVKTISIEQVQNIALLINPTLSQQFTEDLRDRFVRQSELKLTDRNGDLTLTGQITRYDVQPINITSQETAAQNRLTVGIRMKMVNLKYPDKNWEKEFVQFSDFPQTQDLSLVESRLIPDLNERLTQDIFNKTLADW
jgi:Lipopolysaccharide-assembly